MACSVFFLLSIGTKFLIISNSTEAYLMKPFSLVVNDYKRRADS